jgi:hypothetical protein
MNTRLIQKGSALLLLFASSLTLAQAPQVINVPLSNPGEPVTLEIEIVSAHIEVIGEDREDAAFEVSVLEGQRKIITPSGTQSLKSSAYSIDIEEEGNRITLDADWRANRVKIVARIPRNANLELSTVNDGVILVSHITGKLWLQNTNGPITATDINGSVIADSVNEDITVSFASMDPGTVMSFSSVNGDLNIGIPSKTGVQLLIDTADGEIYSDFEVDVQPSKPVISREEGETGVEVRVESIIIANVNGGGSAIKLKTLNGDIQISKSD